MRARPSGFGAGRERWWEGVAIILVSLLAFLLRIYRAQDQSVWGDELYSVMYANMGLADIIRFNLRALDPQAPLFYLLLKLWVTVAGQTELALRMPSILGGVVLVPAVYVLGRYLVGGLAGLLAAVILAVNPFHVWYAQEVRTYSITVLLTTLSTLLFLRVLRGEHSWRLGSAYIAVTSLSIYSHYFSLLIVIFQMVAFVLVGVRRGAPGRFWALCLGGLFLPYLPWIKQAAGLILTYPAWRPNMTDWELTSRLFRFFNIGWFIEGELTPWILAGFAILGMAGVVAHIALGAAFRAYFQAREALILLLLYLGIPFLLAIVYYRLTGRFLFQERYFIIITPAYYLLVANGLTALRRVSPALLAGGLIFILASQAYALGNYYYLPQYTRADYRAVAAFVQAREQPDDIAVTMGDLVTAGFTHYYKGSMPVVNFGFGVPDGDIAGRLEELNRRYQRIWFLPYAEGSRDLAAEDWLNSHSFKIDNRWLPAARVALYAKKEEAADVVMMSTKWENQIELSRLEVASRQVNAGETVGLSLTWKVLSKMDRNYNVGLRLSDTAGHQVAQVDRRPGDGRRPTSQWKEGDVIPDNYGLLVPGSALPGRYRVSLTIYDSESLRQLAYFDEQENTPRLGLAIMELDVTSAPSPTSPDSLEMAHKLNRDLGGGLWLLGYDLPEQALPGENLSLSLYWQAKGKPSEDLTFVLSPLGSGGQVVSSREGSLANAVFPTSKWGTGSVLQDFLDFSSPADPAGGDYPLRLDVRSSRGIVSVPLGTLKVRGRAPRYDIPKIQHRLDVPLGNALLLGYDTDSTLGAKAGGTLPVTLYWKANGATDMSYKVFLHLTNAENRPLSQQDDFPMGGLAPTSAWRPGEVITDLHKLIIKSDVPAGEYRLLVGLYEPETGLRLKTPQGEDSVLLEKVTVRPP